MSTTDTDFVPALSFEGVEVQYDDGAPSVLTRCTFTVHANERVALLGSNGSGKTSILLASVGLLAFTGSIKVLGTPLSRATARAIRKQVGFLFANPEDQILFPRVIDDVAFALSSHGLSSKESAYQARLAMSLLGIEHLSERSPYTLSRGERLRVALAGTIAPNPPLLLLDEPTSGLDPSGVRRLGEQLRRLPSAMLIASHDLEFSARCCDRWLLVEGGRIIAEGNDFQTVKL